MGERQGTPLQRRHSKEQALTGGEECKRGLKDHKWGRYRGALRQTHSGQGSHPTQGHPAFQHGIDGSLRLAEDEITGEIHTRERTRTHKGFTPQPCQPQEKTPEMTRK